MLIQWIHKIDTESRVVPVNSVIIYMAIHRLSDTFIGIFQRMYRCNFE